MAQEPVVGKQALQPMRAAAALQQMPPRQAPEGQVALCEQAAPGAVELQASAPAGAPGQGRQAPALAPPPMALKVLGGQGVGVCEKAGQKAPGGHRMGAVEGVGQ